MSQKSTRAPWRTKASAVVTNPKEGTTTVSPGPMSSSMALISSAAVHEVVSSTSLRADLGPEELGGLRRERAVGRGVAELHRPPTA